MSPRRIQRKRTKGWRAPEGAVYVGRGTKWGNPFSAVDCAERYPSLSSEQVANFVVSEFRHNVYALHSDYPGPGQVLAELRGRDLMCFCALDQPCHADVLLELANCNPSKPLVTVSARSVTQPGSPSRFPGRSAR